MLPSFLHFRSFLQLRWSAQSCPPLGNPMGCSPPGSSVHGILQVRILSGVPFLLQGILPTQGLNLCLLSPASAGGFFTTEPPGKPLNRSGLQKEKKKKTILEWIPQTDPNIFHFSLCISFTGGAFKLVLWSRNHNEWRGLGRSIFEYVPLPCTARREDCRFASFSRSLAGQSLHSPLQIVSVSSLRPPLSERWTRDTGVKKG